MSRPHFQPESLKASFHLGEDYEVQDVVGEGTYSVVCSALHKSSGQKVAIKRLRPFQQSTLCLRTLREIKLLRHFQHENIVSLLGIHKPRNYGHFHDVYLIQDLMETNLLRVTETQELSNDHCQYLIYQTLRGLKICDFALARSAASIGKDRGLAIENVGTRWYRAPEIMLTPEQFTQAIDVWSVGCILAEMLGRKPLFPGEDYHDQLIVIFGVLGLPVTDDYHAIKSHNARKYIRSLSSKAKTPWKDIFPKASDLALDLLNCLLKFNPIKRITVEAALQHLYLKQYHDPEDEPTAAPISEQLFDFDNNRESLDEEQLKSEMT